jgi:hypothetical protein
MQVVGLSLHVASCGGAKSYSRVHIRKAARTNASHEEHGNPDGHALNPFVLGSLIRKSCT